SAEEEEERHTQHIGSSSPSLGPRLGLIPSMGMHTPIAHPSNTNGNSLVIEADEQIEDERMKKEMTEDGRTTRLRMLTLGRTGMVKEEMYPVGYSADAPLATYEVEVMTTREGNAAVVSSTMGEEEEQPVYSEMTRAQLIEEMEEEEESVGSDRVRVMGERSRAMKGRRTKWPEEMEAIEAHVDRQFLEQVLPQPPRVKRKKRSGPPTQSRNLDWIIDAVAQGQDVDSMSPHNRKKPMIHTCEYCGKTDKYPSKIQAHMRTHTGEKPYTCDFCGIGFAQKTPLRMHIRRHLNERPYECIERGCGMKFISQALLNAHNASRHSNTKRFVCMKGCGRWFANARNQRQHETKCSHMINRTTVNTDYNPLEGMEEGSYQVEATDEEDGEYLDDEEEAEEEYEGEEGHEDTLHMHGDEDMNIQPQYL
ncbi:hypothetical protein PMAYCL1PPCAC_23370, partial [Pristionchus mayeri]